MSIKCFLCGNEQADPLPYSGSAVVHYVKCPNCGEYMLSEQARIEIDNGIYQEETFPIISGEVFDGFYYKEEIKLVKTDDFRAMKTVTTLEKLYSLAKFAYVKSKNSLQKDVPCKPAACYADREEWYELLDELKRLGIVDFAEVSDPPTDQNRCRIILPIKMTMRGRIAFEKGINSPKEFEEVFMGGSIKKYPRTKQDALDFTAKIPEFKQNISLLGSYLTDLGAYNRNKLNSFLNQQIF
jgi:hypothetical protein